MHGSVVGLSQALRALPFEPYAPVREQLPGLVRAIDLRRKIAGLELVPTDTLWWRRRPV